MEDFYLTIICGLGYEKVHFVVFLFYLHLFSRVLAVLVALSCLHMWHTSSRNVN